MSFWRKLVGSPPTKRPETTFHSHDQAIVAPETKLQSSDRTVVQDQLRRALQVARDRQQISEPDVMTKLLVSAETISNYPTVVEIVLEAIAESQGTRIGDLKSTYMKLWWHWYEHGDETGRRADRVLAVASYPSGYPGEQMADRMLSWLNEGAPDRTDALSKHFGDPPTKVEIERFQSAETVERLIRRSLQQIENRLKSQPDSALPLVRLQLKETPFGQQIVWCFATDYGVSLNVKAAQELLNQELRPLGLVTSDHGYMGGKGDRNNLFSYTEISSPQFEPDIKRLDAMKREPALEEARRLLESGNLELLTAWVCQGQYSGIPAEILRQSNNQGAVPLLIQHLKDGSPQIQARAASALGPLGGEAAAKALSEALQGAKSSELRTIARAIGRLAWHGSVPALTEQLRRAEDATAAAVMAEALVRCGAKNQGFDVLFLGMLRDDGNSNEFGGALSRLDEEGISDERLVTEMKSLIERTKNNNSSEIAMKVLRRHQAVDEFGALKNPPELATKYTPRADGKVETINGLVSMSVDRASEITGLSAEEIRELANARCVFSHTFQSSLVVQVHGSYPRGRILYHANPRWRAIGANAGGNTGT